MSDFEKMDDMQDVEELDSTVVLTDEDGNEMTFEFLDLVEYNDKPYVVLMPALEDEEEDGEVIILEVALTDDGEETYTSIEDEATLDAIFEAFKEKHQDEFNFVD